MTRRERMERKLEKREEWADKAAARSTTRLSTAHDLAQQLTPGQPILVGHHSEKRHRRSLARINSTMRKGIEESDKADHHQSKAAGLEHQLATSIYSDDPDALEALTAKIEKLEQAREAIKATNRVIRRKPKNSKTDQKVADLVAIGHPEAVAVALFQPDSLGYVGIPPYKLQNLGGMIRNAKQRIEDVKARVPKEITDAQTLAIDIRGILDMR